MVPLNERVLGPPSNSGDRALRTPSTSVRSVSIGIPCKYSENTAIARSMLSVGSACTDVAPTKSTNCSSCSSVAFGKVARNISELISYQYLARSSRLKERFQNFSAFGTMSMPERFIISSFSLPPGVLAIACSQISLMDLLPIHPRPFAVRSLSRYLVPCTVVCCVPSCVARATRLCSGIFFCISSIDLDASGGRVEPSSPVLRANWASSNTGSLRSMNGLVACASAPYCFSILAKKLLTASRPVIPSKASRTTRTIWRNMYLNVLSWCNRPR